MARDPRPTSRSLQLRRAVALLLAVGVAAACPALADLVTTTDRGLLHVDAYEVEGDWARLFLTDGGVLLMPLAKIDRVISDKVEVGEGPVPEIDVDLGFSPAAQVPSTPFGELIFETSSRHGVNPALVAAVIDVESAFQVDAVSHKGARGLMQLMPATAERFGVASSRLFEAEQNLEAGVRYLKWLGERYPDDPTRVLAAYNAGEGAVDKYGGVPPYDETRNYLRRLARRFDGTG